ncbi:MAG TPA: AAA family ATPase, partial [Gaiellaceae bacterium]|nr:AAA family ATPase [Gaiellaceae bacterium]
SQAVHDRSCQLFTVLGSAGVGKSRLAAEFLRELDARVVRGRCLSYGDGITYWPVVEILKQLGTLPDGDAARPLRFLLGESETPADADEIAWGFRKLLEQEAQTQPLVCVLDDLHWAEETLIDLVEHAADLSRDAPLLLLCMARPELLERRPSWGGGKWNATTVLLEPLDAAETERLITELGGVGDELRERILQVAEGNPLFLEEMIGLVRDSGGSEVEVPATIQALLAARLDQLDPDERSVLERGSVEGRTFHRGAVAALSDSDGSLDQRLVALVRKELVRPDRAQLTGDEAYRFRHLLIRDAAYDALPKATRAELHHRFAEWLEEHGRNLLELDEILGYHLEQAHRYRIELGAGGEETEELARRASERLAAAGARALVRHDVAAAVGLLDRALALLPAGARSAQLEVDAIQARKDAGDLAGAVALADTFILDARAAADLARELRLRVSRAFVAFLAEGTGGSEIRKLVEQAIEVFSEAGDDAALAEAWLLVGHAELNDLHWRAMAVAVERAREHADRVGGHSLVQEIGLAPRVYGPFPVEEALAWFDANAPSASFEPALRGQLESMRGNFELARRLVAGAIEEARERGQLLLAAGQRMQQEEVELNAGDAEAAAEAGRKGVEELGGLGEHGWLSTVAGHAAEALYRLGQDDEAWRMTETADEAGAVDDTITQMQIRQVRAKLLARRGEHAEAERLVLEAVAWGEPTDSLEVKANSYRDLAIVLTASGKRDEALAALAQAQALYEEKGHTVGMGVVEGLLAEWGATLER